MVWTGTDPRKWVEEKKERLQATYRQSIDDLATEMGRTRTNGGRLPHDTGNLMRSLLASTAGPVRKGGPGEKYAGQDVGLVTTSLTLDQDIWLGWQADYAHRLNYGFTGEDKAGRLYAQAGAHFLEAALAQWPNIVNNAARKIMQGAGGG